MSSNLKAGSQERKAGERNVGPLTHRLRQKLQANATRFLLKLMLGLEFRGC